MNKPTTQDIKNRFIITLEYINNQTPENWKKLERFIVNQLDFDTRLEISKSPELY